MTEREVPTYNGDTKLANALTIRSFQELLEDYYLPRILAGSDGRIFEVIDHLRVPVWPLPVLSHALRADERPFSIPTHDGQGIQPLSFFPGSLRRCSHIL